MATSTKCIQFAVGILTGLSGSFIAGTSLAESVTAVYSHNGVALSAESRVAFEATGMPLRESVAQDNGLAHPDVGVFGEAAVMDSVLPDPPITTGDEASLIVRSRFEFGSPPGTLWPDDRWIATFEGIASAVDAHVGGVPADAVVSGVATASFFIDPIGPSSGPNVGWITFDAISPLGQKEIDLGAMIKIELRENDSIVIPRFPGDTLREWPLSIGNAYQLEATYNLRVPHGMDPPFLIEISASIIPIPEPSTMSLAASIVSAVAVACRVRRSNCPRAGPAANRPQGSIELCWASRATTEGIAKTSLG